MEARLSGDPIESKREHRKAILLKHGAWRIWKVTQAKLAYRTIPQARSSALSRRLIGQVFFYCNNQLVQGRCIFKN